VFVRARLGGFNGSVGVVTAVRIFDTSSCTWSDGPDLPRMVHHANVAALDGTIYVLGSIEALSFTPVGDVWSWTPATETSWSTRQSMPAGTARGSAVVGAIGDRIVVAGGLGSGAETTVSAYVPSTDSWDEAHPPLPVPRDHGCGGVVDGALYVLGGREGAIESQSNRAFSYTPGGAWSEVSPMPTARGGTACGVLTDRIVVIGGEGNPDVASGVFAQVEAYSPAEDSWETLEPMRTPRHGTGAAASGGVIFVPGGASQQAFGAVDTHEALLP
jgi:N-acetylneuraminic acid mutarotase